MSHGSDAADGGGVPVTDSILCDVMGSVRSFPFHIMINRLAKLNDAPLSINGPESLCERPVNKHRPADEILLRE